MNLNNMSKCLKCAANDDIITLKVRLSGPLRTLSRFVEQA